MITIVKALKTKKVLVPLVIAIVIVTSLVIVLNVPFKLSNPLAQLLPESRTTEIKANNFTNFMFGNNWVSSTDSENIQAPGISIMAWKIIASEVILKTQFGLDSLYLRNGTGKVLLAHDIIGYINGIQYENGFTIIYKSVHKNTWFLLSESPPSLLQFEPAILNTILNTNTK